MGNIKGNAIAGPLFLTVVPVSFSCNLLSCCCLCVFIVKYAGLSPTGKAVVYHGQPLGQPHGLV